MRYRRVITLAIASVLSIAALLVSIVPRLEIPAPSGPHAVGRTIYQWVDRSRPEILTEDTRDFRQLSAVLWYPAEPGSGADSAYYPGLAGVAEALVESGEVARWEVAGLRFVRSKISPDAAPVAVAAPYPVVILSPGNGTNIEFYSSLAGEIASHGYVVVGLNHPYDVAAAQQPDGSVAPYDRGQWSLTPDEHQAYTRARIKVRTAEVLFALAQLEALQSTVGSPFKGLLDLESLAVAGHSLGGVTASEACKAELRFRACINFDGLLEGGPFSTDTSSFPPSQPFLFLTKEAELHPELLKGFESRAERHWVVVDGAQHDSFTDAPMLRASLSPFPGDAGRVMALIQQHTLAFLDQTLRSDRALASATQIRR